MRRLFVVLMVLCISVSAFASSAENQKGMHEKCTSLACKAERKAIEEQLKKAWSEMSVRLAGGDIEGALVFFADSARDSFRQRFVEMGNEKLSSFFSKPEIRLDRLSSESADCIAVHSEKESKYFYPVSFIRTEKEGWKISGF